MNLKNKYLYNMLKRLLAITAIVLFCTSFSIPEKIIKKADKEIAKFFDTEDISKEIYVISENANSSTPSEFGDGNLFKIYSDGMHLGYGYIGKAPSQAATFDYLVLFDTNLIITKSKILVYREEYGGEIGSKRWLKQFIGVASNVHELIYGEDIIPISGATISVRSMTQAMNDLLKSINYLQTSKLL